MDVQNRYFANVIHKNGQVVPMPLKQFVALCDKILGRDPATYQTILGVQAYRDHKIPLVITKSRETFTHCLEYRDAKYYSLIKNRKSLLTTR